MDGNRCIPCAAGYFAYGYASKECKPCPRGKYSLPGASECTLCAPGEYQGAIAGTVCQVCPAGEVQVCMEGGACVGGRLVTASLSCPVLEAHLYPTLFLDAGTTSTSDRTTCVQCLSGTIAPTSGTHEDGCVACNPNEYAPYNGSTVCR